MYFLEIFAIIIVLIMYKSQSTRRGFCGRFEQNSKVRICSESTLTDNRVIYIDTVDVPKLNTRCECLITHHIEGINFVLKMQNVTKGFPLKFEIQGSIIDRKYRSRSVRIKNAKLKLDTYINSNTETEGACLAIYPKRPLSKTSFSIRCEKFTKTITQMPTQVPIQVATKKLVKFLTTCKPDLFTRKIHASETFRPSTTMTEKNVFKSIWSSEVLTTAAGSKTGLPLSFITKRSKTSAQPISGQTESKDIILVPIVAGLSGILCGLAVGFLGIHCCKRIRKQLVGDQSAIQGNLAGSHMLPVVAKKENVAEMSTINQSKETIYNKIEHDIHVITMPTSHEGNKPSCVDKTHKHLYDHCTTFRSQPKSKGNAGGMHTMKTRTAGKYFQDTDVYNHLSTIQVGNYTSDDTYNKIGDPICEW